METDGRERGGVLGEGVTSPLPPTRGSERALKLFGPQTHFWARKTLKTHVGSGYKFH